MSNIDLYLVILIVSVFTIFFRVLPVYIKINNNNKYINAFFDILPISIITVLAIPEIFTSIGSELKDIIICLIAILFVAYLTFKEKSLGFIAISSVLLVILLRGIYFGSF